MTRIIDMNDAPQAASGNLPARRILVVNAVVAAVVITTWGTCGGSRALHAVVEHWEVATAMVLGSLVGGGTAEGGGAVAFPVLTKVLLVPPEQARIFSFAIQSIGMTAASVTILWNRSRIEWAAIIYGGIPAVPATVLSVLYVAPLLSGPQVRLTFTAVLIGLVTALVISRRYRPARRERIFERRADTVDGLLPRRDILLITVAGTLGGVLSGVSAVGIDTLMFILLVLLFRVSENTATPTTVVLMTIVTLAAFAAVLMTNQFSGTVVDMWLAAVPIVSIGAPLGALICTRLSATVIARILYVLIAVEVISTFVLVPMSRAEAGAFGIAIVAFTAICLRMTTVRQMDVTPTLTSSADDLCIGGQRNGLESTAMQIATGRPRRRLHDFLSMTRLSEQQRSPPLLRQGRGWTESTTATFGGPMIISLTDPTLVPKHIIEAWRDHDADGFAEAFTEDAAMILPGVCQKGRPAIAEFMRKAFAGPYQGTQVVGEPFDIRMLTPDVAILLTEGGVHSAGAETLDDSARVRATWVLHRDGDQWRIASYANSPR